MEQTYYTMVTLMHLLDKETIVDHQTQLSSLRVRPLKPGSDTILHVYHVRPAEASQPSKSI